MNNLTNLSLTELKTLATGLEIVGHKGRKASYVAAIELSQVVEISDAIDATPQQIKAEIEATLLAELPSTTFAVSYNSNIGLHSIQWESSLTESQVLAVIGKFFTQTRLELVCNYQPAIKTIEPAAIEQSHCSPVAIALIPVLMFAMAIAIVSITIRASLPTVKHLGVILMGLRMPRVCRSIDYFPELSIA
jgi:hypothetical protein